MKKILCPTDFSEASLNAIEFASRIAEKMNAHLTLLTIYNQDTAKLLAKGEKADTYEGWKEVAEAHLKRICSEIKDTCGPKGLKSCSYLLSESGDITATIKNAEKAERAELIVMGTEGAKDVTESYVGSSTYQVVQEADCPVLCIPKNATYQHFHKIVYATDYQEEDKLVVQKLANLCSLYQAQLLILHVSSEDALVEKATYNDYQEQLRNFVASVPVRFVNHVHEGDVSRSLEHYMSTEKAQLMAILKQDRNFLEKMFHTSLSKKLSNFTDYPLLIFKE